MSDLPRVAFDDLEMDADQRMSHDGEPFSGIAYEETSGGRLVTEAEFADGLQDGRTREWSGTGQLIEDLMYRRGARHGRFRTWHENGVLASEGDYEFSLKTRETTWDQAGVVTREWQIAADDPNAGLLQSFRRTYGEP